MRENGAVSREELLDDLAARRRSLDRAAPSDHLRYRRLDRGEIGAVGEPEIDLCEAPIEAEQILRGEDVHEREGAVEESRRARAHFENAADREVGGPG